MDTEHTQGSLTKEAIRLAWPAVCESFFIALAGMVDTFMVSTLGANAVAAVGLTTQPKFLGLAQSPPWWRDDLERRGSRRPTRFW